MKIYHIVDVHLRELGNVAEEQRKKIRNELEKYCCIDTEGMILIIDKINKLII